MNNMILIIPLIQTVYYSGTFYTKYFHYILLCLKFYTTEQLNIRAHWLSITRLCIKYFPKCVIYNILQWSTYWLVNGTCFYTVKWTFAAASRQVRTITWLRWSCTTTLISCVPTIHHHQQHHQHQQQCTVTDAGVTSISSSTSSTWSVCGALTL